MLRCQDEQTARCGWPMSEGSLTKQGHCTVSRRWGEGLALPGSPEEDIKDGRGCQEGELRVSAHGPVFSTSRNPGSLRTRGVPEYLTYDMSLSIIRLFNECHKQISPAAAQVGSSIQGENCVP